MDIKFNISLEFIKLTHFLYFSILLSLILFCVSFFLIYKTFDFEKLTVYECGFNPFDDARSRFDIKFYLVAILYLIFDIEIVFFYPYVYSFFFNSFFLIYIILLFLFIILLGFFYEWKKGVLTW